MGRHSESEPLIESLEASDVARERATVILLTLSKQWSVADALARLSISRTRFGVLRRRMLQQALSALEPRAAGRPVDVEEHEHETIRRLRRDLVRLKHEFKRVRVQLELAEGPASEAIARRLHDVFLSKTWRKT